MRVGNRFVGPMARTDGDCRGWLALDADTACFGPLLSVLPPGLLLELTLQGDVIQSAKVLRVPFAQDGADEPLRRVARLLRLLGLAGAAERFLRAVPAQTGDLRILDRPLRWSGALHAIPPGLGEITGEDVRARLRRWWKQAQGIASDRKSTRL